MQLYPDQPSGVVLDAIAVNTRLSDMDGWFDALGKTYLEACGADPFCAGKLGADPWAQTTATLAAFDQGACPEVHALGFDRPLLHALFSSFLYQWDDRTMISPLIYRLGRCSPADVNAYTHLANLLAAPQELPASRRFYSLMLSAHITLSELWPTPPPALADLQAFADGANFAHRIPTFMGAFHALWPRYTPDAYAGPLATYTGPLLMLRSGLDFIPAAVADPLKAEFQGPLQTLVDMPRAPHGAMKSPTKNGSSCGGVIFKKFVDDPTVAVDTSCTALVQQLSFNGPAPLSFALFGTGDAWEGDPGLQPMGPIPPLPPPGARLRARVQELTRALIPNAPSSRQPVGRMARAPARTRRAPSFALRAPPPLAASQCYAPPSQ